MFPLQEGEKINVALALTGEKRNFPADQYVFMSTSMGTVKKTALDEFNNPRKGGIIAVNLDDGDYPIGAALTDAVSDPDRAQAYGVAGRHRAIESFSWDAIAARTVDLYRSLL